MSTSKRKGEYRSSGPTTEAGRRRVRHNALQHGFYSKQLMVDDNEKSEFEALRTNLNAELKPDTTMKLVAFERLLCAVWRVRLAFRMEERKLKMQARLDAEQEKATDVTTDTPEQPRWYTSGRGPLWKAIRLITNLRAQFVGDGGNVRLEDQKEWIVRTFGPEFYELIASWRVEDEQAVLLAETLTHHSEKYNLPLPETLLQKDAGQNFVVDQRAKWDMIVKLLDLKLQDLGEMHRLLGNGNELSGAQQHTTALDTISRYITSSVRELERSFDWYLHVSEKQF